FWPKGQPLAPYGLWKLDEARKAAFLLVVEGESDCWALWHHGLPALGLPGSGTARLLTSEMLVGLERVYVHREPDLGGDRFRVGVVARLGELGYVGRAFELHMPDGVKDPADLHAADAGRFKERLAGAMGRAALTPPGRGVRPTMPPPSHV